MLNIIITEEFNDEKSLIEGLKHITNSIEKGYIYGYNPNWELKDSTEKDTQIEKIKSIIRKWGETTSTYLELDSSPCIYSQMISNRNKSKLIEQFKNNSVTVVTYLDETEIDEDEVDYKDLSDNTIDEICNLIENYDLSQQELYDSCRDENWD